MRKTLLSLACLLLMGNAKAEDITVIDWNVLQMDSVQLPLYSETVPLANDYRQFDFKVKIEYPEWAPLTDAEANMARHFDVPASIQPESTVGTVNRRGMLDISFVPVIKEKGTYKKLVSCRLTVEATRRMASGAKAATRAEAETPASSVLSSGRWIKIYTTTEGIHSISPSQLAKWGFSNPANVRVYGYGGHLLPEKLGQDTHFNDLPEVPTYLDKDGNIMFWMNGLVAFDSRNGTAKSTPRHTTNYCANYASYFLTEGETTLGNEPSSAETPIQTLTTFTHTVLHEKDEFAYAQIGRRLFEKATINASTTYQLSTPDPANENVNGNMIICISGAQAGTVTPVINDQSMLPLTIGERGEYDKAQIDMQNYTIRAEDKTTTMQFKQSLPEGHLDFIEYSYERKLKLKNNDALCFKPTNSGTTAIKIESPANSEVVLWRLPEPDMPGARIMPNAEGTYIVDDPQHTYVAFCPTSGTWHTPQMASVIQNQDLRAESEEVDMVIITPASGIFDSEAQRLADAHAQTDGLRCRVVRADKIYNEFSSGTPDVTAYRMYMKMLYDRQQTAPRHLLLFGACASDNRMLSYNWKNYNPDNFLLCYESDNSWSDTDSYMCEEYIGMLDEGEGGTPKSDKSDISVGRFPVRTEAEARVLVDKTIAHLEGRSGVWNNRVVIMGDDGDNNSHMDYANKIAVSIEQKAPDMEVRRVMWDAYKRESSALRNTFPEAVSAIERLNNEGVLMFNYTGHGATYVLSHENVITLDNIKKWENQHCPLWFTAACDVMPIDGTAENIGQEMVLNSKGGAVAFIGTTRTVYAAQNYTLNLNFCGHLFDSDPEGRRYSVGEALRMAKNSGVSNTANKLQYILIGDPSLVFGNPQHKVVIDEINGQTTDNQQLRAGSRATMSGHIVDAAGNVMSDFNGVVNSRVLDSEVQVTCHNAAGVKNGPFTFMDRNRVLYEGCDSVKGGHFDITFIVPVDINYSNEAGRVNFYAASGQTEANGYCTNFLVGGISNELADDTQGPNMFITLGDNEFVNGGKVNSTPCFMAALSDESGINTSSGGIGHNLELSVDGKAAMTYNLNSYYTADPDAFGSGQVVFTIPELEAGEHTLTFRAWDLLNNPSTRSLAFVVDNSFTPNVSQVTMSPNPAKNFTNIYITHNCTGSAMDVEINVYDYAGRLLTTFTRTGQKATNTVYTTWDLTVDGGARLSDGIYLVRARICRDGVWSDGETQKLFITKQ